MLKNLFTLLAFIPCLTYGQLTEDFTDGDFTNNPVWSGDAGEFIVNASQQLQLNNSAAGNSFLSTPLNLTSLSNIEWRFYIKQSFAPSSLNYGRVYLVSDQSNLENPLNGYYLQFGEALSLDAVELFRQTGTTSTSVARGTDGQIAASFTISVKVTRDNSGLWQLFVDPVAGTNFQLEASGTDNTYNSSVWFGAACTYTLSNATNFYFDDFSVGPLVVDLTPPSVSSINVISQNQIDVNFSEPVEQTSAETELNYTVNNGIGNPSSAMRDGSNTGLVHLTFATNFASGTTNTLSVLNVEDLNGNAITTASTGTFAWFAPVTPSKYDVVITEFMPDPNPVISLPDEEYFEIYNRSNKTFDLNGWKISDSGSPVNLTSFILTPNSYLILCSTTNVSLFASFGNVLGVSSFPGLNNASSGGNDDIVIYDNNSIVIDKIHYDETFYNDPLRKDGGYSIERIDKNFTCPNSLNFKASVNQNGGTPGSVNSVDGIFSDAHSPLLLRASVVDATHVKVYFDEPMNETMLALVSSYMIDNSIGNPVSVSIQADVQSAVLTLSQTIQQGIIYRLTVLPSITDCAGNTLDGNNIVRFAIPDSVIAVSDILINEVLFNPKDAGVGFVEIYNRSNKVFDLSRLKIASLKEGTDNINYHNTISSEGYLFFPGDYVAITENPSIVKSQYQTINQTGFVTTDSVELILYTDNGTVLITDLYFNRIDQFYYTEDFHFSLLNDPEGVSLERISFNRATQDSTNWHSAAESAGFATPAYENSQHAEEINDGSEVSVVPEIFSPDNDGLEDVVNILYHFDSPGYTANLKIFDSNGRQIIHLIKNQLLGTEEGSFTWDGITETNEKARVGIHVIYLEVFNADGVVKKFKKPVVVAIRF